MSQVYNLEPPTQGKVVLKTTLGDLDIELWPKEAPQATRNFVQLCVEGYYDNTIFHRIIKDFMVQGGDPTGTGNGGESIYGRPFKDEFHSRLKFNHRGLVACANQNKPDTNGSQFFVTLDRADHCNRQYTIFGKITGDTIYNLSRFNELEAGEDDRPEHPPVLLRAEVLWNPFDDLQPRVDRDAKEAADKAAAEAAAAEAKRATRKQGKNFALMSFGDEAEEEDAEAAEAAAKLKIRSAHDALEDERLAKEPAVEVDLQRVREAMRAAKAQQAAQAEQQQGSGGEGGEEDFTSHMRRKLEEKRKAMGIEQPAARQQEQQRQEQKGGEEPELDYGEGSEEEEEEEQDDEGPRKRSRLAEQGRGRKSSAAVVAPSRQIKVADSELLTDWERKRQEYKQRKRLGGSREKETLARLAKFRQGLKSKPVPAPEKAGAEAERQQGAQPAAASEQQQQQGKDNAGYSGKVREDIDHRAYMPAAWRIDDYLGGEDGEGGEEDDDLDLASLRAHRLKFAKDRKDAMSRSDNIDDYVVHDPLLEAGKAKFNKQQQRAKKRQSEWAGRAQG
ncbi:peptidyl-prolyl cis-trans isomerase CYP57 [Chlorella sorokiniana]|uniref:Peptidyl-prolyl cis-trans isomerase CYP57 n=1 Tax=Chlorella sorokiniana TaxID=3076 RepID=A0A2P6TVY9_CHLSO|nr:peptidyl-prolyl cis-trans isomerase CYP57 [Chlorella sorokiniana]|eukprot:PRW58227.1 peptidyl-prolyl cis-trans isomerase CYP57 [Chlorella sorokiniana]